MNAGRGDGAQFGLEARARAAVLATADEIRAGDVPSAPAWLSPEGPLDGRAGRDHHRAGRAGRSGPGPGGWRRRGAGDRGQRGKRGGGRWGLPLAAAAAVVMAAGVTAALTVNRIGQRTGVTAGVTSPVAAAVARPAVTAASDASAAPAAKAGPAPYPADLAAGLIGRFIPASGAQYAAGARLQGAYLALESQVTSRCMAKDGFRVAPVTPASIAGQDRDLIRYPDLGAIAKAGALPGLGTHRSGPGSGPVAFETAYKQCGAASDALFSPMVTAGGKLGAPFAATVTGIQGSAPVLATVPALRACAARHGWAGPGSGQPIDSFADLATWVSGRLDAARGRQASQAAGRKTDAWWAAAFVQCGRPAVTVMEKLQLAAQRHYLAGHAGQFAALAAVAKSDFAHAAGLARG